MEWPPAHGRSGHGRCTRYLARNRLSRVYMPRIYAEGSSDLHRILGMAFAACLSMRRPYMDNMHCVFGSARALQSTGSNPCTPYTRLMRSVKDALSDSRGMLLGQLPRRRKCERLTPKTYRFPHWQTVCCCSQSQSRAQ